MAERYEDQYRRDRGYRRDERGFIDRAGDEVRSWFGDDDAERRRQLDDRERGYVRDREGYPGYGDRSGGSQGGYPSGYRYSERPQGYGERPQGYGDRAQSYGDRAQTYGDRSFGSGSSDRAYYGGDRSLGASDARSGYGSGTSYGSGASLADRDDRGGGTGWFVGRGPKGYQRSDARINEDVCDRLCDSGEIDATDVEVRVENGEVTLSGSVSDRSQKRRAEDLIEQVSGVREVHNNLRVGYSDAGTTPRATGTTTGTTAASSAATPEQPGNVLGVTGGVDKTAAAGRR
jgi:osmotically-inducible protein OsmY